MNGAAPTPPARLRVLLDNIKFVHTVFALPFALMAMFLAQPTNASRLADRVPHWGVFALIVVCMVAARSAAMTANRILDAQLDARNPRTANRPMVTGRLSAGAAWAFLAAMVAALLAGSAGFWMAFGNRWPLLLSPIAMAVLGGYPLAKRFTSLAHFWLGAALALAPVGAWVATAGGVRLETFVLAGAVLLWTAGFDIIYACQDVAVDRRDGLFAVPARLGVSAALWISRGCHAVAAALLIAVGLLDSRLGWLYGLGVSLAIVLLVVEQSLVRPSDLSKVNVAFFTLNGVVSLTLAAFAIADVLGG